LMSITTRFTGIAKLGEQIRLSAKLSHSDHVTATYTITGHTDSGVEVVSGSAVICCK
jgi:hypothetical protein